MKSLYSIPSASHDTVGMGKDQERICAVRKVFI